ncbi:inositol monophosphatase [bacterium]|nr:inositol monophosphatase [bacterium]
MPSDRKLKDTLYAAAELGRQVLLKHFGKIRSPKHKSEVDLVTVADHESEAAILGVIRDVFPDHAILAEESGDAGAKGRNSAEYRWVVDPLDGTMNFAHSVPIFSISMALQHKNKTIMGLVVDPIRDEWFFAKKDGGATLNKKRIRVSDVDNLADALIVTGFPHNRREILAPLMDTVARVIMESHGILRLGSAAIDLCYVACGRGEAFYEPSLQPWDILAGDLIVREAGGRCANFKGRPLTLKDRTVIASNGKIHRGLQKILLKEKWEDVPAKK